MWLSLAAAEALAHVCDGGTTAGGKALPHAAEVAQSVAETHWDALASVLKMQAATRGFVARRRRRVDSGALRHSMRIKVHELRLPPELSRSDVVHTAALSLSAAGVELVSASDRPGTFRQRAGRVVLFDLLSTIDLERDSPVHAKLVGALRATSAAGVPCEIRATLTAERLAPMDATGTRRLNLGTDARFTIGEAKLDLRDVLRGGADLLELPLPVRSRSRRAEMATARQTPLLVVSLEGVDALFDVVTAARLPIAQALQGRPVVTAAELEANRWRLATAIQARARGLLARVRRRAPSARAPPGGPRRP